MITLLLCLQLQCTIQKSDIEVQIHDRYPCIEVDLLAIARAKHPRIMWKLFEREHVFTTSRRDLKQIKAMFQESRLL